MTGKSYPPVIVNDQTCDAKNNQPRMNITMNSTSCKYQYEYLVAVVATKNSSVLLELQNYQMKESANYLKSAFISTLLILGYLLY